MKSDHPITPPSELVQQWGHNANLSGVPHNDEHWAYEQHIATRAAQWGADQELEACCEYLVRCAKWEPEDVDELHTARRPKPPSLKKQALAELAEWENIMDIAPDSPIRRALEALDE